MNYTIEIDQEEDGKIIAEIKELPGVLVYGQTKKEAIAKVQALALRVLEDKIAPNSKISYTKVER